MGYIWLKNRFPFGRKKKKIKDKCAVDRAAGRHVIFFSGIVPQQMYA